MSNLKNTSEISLEFLAKVFAEETEAKHVDEVKGAKRREIALRLALDSVDMRDQFTRLVALYDTKDEANREQVREGIVKLFGKAKRPEDNGNHITRIRETMTMVVDMLRLDIADDITFHDRGAFVKGDTKLAHAIWSEYEWADKKTMENRHVSEQIKFVAKMNQKKPGDVSWKMLEAVVKTLSGRKQKGGNIVKAGGKALTPDKPIEMLKALGSMAGDVGPEHFSNAAACVAAINTAEDVLALALARTELKDMVKIFSDLFEDAREKLNSTRTRGTEKAAA